MPYLCASPQPPSPNCPLLTPCRLSRALITHHVCVTSRKSSTTGFADARYTSSCFPSGAITESKSKCIRSEPTKSTALPSAGETNVYWRRCAVQGRNAPRGHADYQHARTHTVLHLLSHVPALTLVHTSLRSRISFELSGLIRHTTEISRVTSSLPCE